MPNPFEDDLRPVGALDPAANPFRPGMGLVPPDFGGREEALRRAKTVVDRLAQLAPPEFVLYRGVRGVGKTALLAYLRRQASNRGLHALHLEADRGDEKLAVARETLAREAATLLDGAPAGTGRDPVAAFEELVGTIARLAEESGTGVLLTVDEVHEAEDTLLKPLLRAAHRAAQDGRPLGVLLSGLPAAADNLFEEGQTYTERLGRVELGLLDRAGTAEAVRRPFARHASAEVDDLVVDAVHDASGGYPWFVQLWGAALWDVARRPDRIELPDARAAGAEVHVRVEAFFRDRWARVPTGRATRLAVALAERGGTAEMGDLVDALDLTHQALGPARAGLIETGVAWAPVRGELAFTVPGFASWIVRARPDRP